MTGGVKSKIGRLYLAASLLLRKAQLGQLVTVADDGYADLP